MKSSRLLALALALTALLLPPAYSQTTSLKNRWLSVSVRPQPTTTHAYTSAGNYTAHLVVDGLDGTVDRKSFPIVVRGTAKSSFDERNYRRYQDHRP
jgi:hypothetical protein